MRWASTSHELLQRGALIRASKAGVAATLAWLAVQPMSGIADKYPYYAPLGAVVAVASTVAGSFRGSVQGVGAIGLGALVALAASPLATHPALGLALVVLVGAWLAGWRRLGPMGDWVPIAALFVLIIGKQDPVEYAFAYLGLTTLGAVIGVAVNVAFPPLPIADANNVLQDVRHTLCKQLSSLAEALRGDEPPTAEQWRERQHDISTLTEHMRQELAHFTEAHRVNWRAPFWRDRSQQHHDLSTALERLAWLVSDVTTVLADQEEASRERVALGPDLRPCAANLLEAVAAALNSVQAGTADPERLRTVDASTRELADAIRRTRHETGDDLFVASALVVSVRRAVRSMVPEDLAQELPTDG